MDTKLFARSQPGGLFSIVNREDFPTGNIWWVDSTNTTNGANSAGYGANPDAPFLTLAYAETQASAGDTIFVMPGHTETLASATGAAVLTLDLARLKVIGLGGRSTKPAFLIDGHAANYVTVTGADVVLENLTFKAGHADIAKGLLIAAAGCEIRKCDFIENVATENFLFSIMTSNAADSMVVEDCRFVSIDAAADAGIHIVGACNDVIIRRNYFNAPYVTSAIEAITAACLDMLIIDNWISNGKTGNDLAGAIDLVAASTGLIIGNRIYHADDTDILTSIDGANCGRLDNMAVNEFAEEGGKAGTAAT
jgi:hypothetical protein